MKDDAANINQYLQGLKPEIRDRMLLMKPTSLRDAELNALLLEKSIEHSPETQLLASLKSLTSDIQKEHAKVVASATAAANSVTYADPPTTTRSPAPSPPTQRRTSGTYNRTNKQTTNSREIPYNRNRNNTSRNTNPNNFQQWNSNSNAPTSQPPWDARFPNPNYPMYPSQYNQFPSYRQYGPPQFQPAEYSQPAQAPRQKFASYCRICQARHPFGQHVISKPYNNNAPRSMAQQSPQLNSNGQTA